MYKVLSFGLAIISVFLGSSALAAVPSVSDQPEWKLSGKLTNNASIVCADANPAVEPVKQKLPPLTSPVIWQARIRFHPDQTFEYLEANQAVQGTNVSKWPKYEGNWRQEGSKVVLTLAKQSSDKLISSLDSGAKCGNNAPCYNSKKYRLIGKIKLTENDIPQLLLEESVIFAVNNVRASKSFQCKAHWTFRKKYKSES